MKSPKVDTYPSAMRADRDGYYPASRRVERWGDERFVDMLNLTPHNRPMRTLGEAVAEARRIMGWPL